MDSASKTALLCFHRHMKTELFENALVRLLSTSGGSCHKNLVSRIREVFFEHRDTLLVACMCVHIVLKLVDTVFLKNFSRQRCTTNVFTAVLHFCWYQLAPYMHFASVSFSL